MAPGKRGVNPGYKTLRPVAGVEDLVVLNDGPVDRQGQDGKDERVFHEIGRKSYTQSLKFVYEIMWGSLNVS